MGGDSSPLLSPHEAPLAELPPALESPQSEGCGVAGAGPEEATEML